MTGPLSDQQLDEIRRRDVLKGRGESGTTMTQVHIDRRVLLAEVDRLRGENERLTDLAKDHWQESEDEFDRGAASARRAAGLAEEVVELRTRIGNARSEIARQDIAAQLAPHDAAIVGDALAAVDTHLVAPEHRPAPGPAGEGSAA